MGSPFLRVFSPILDPYTGILGRAQNIWKKAYIVEFYLKIWSGMCSFIRSQIKMRIISHLKGTKLIEPDLLFWMNCTNFH